MRELGQIALDASDDEQAAARFEAALAEDAQDSQTHYSLGRVYARLGRTEAAESHLERFQAIVDRQRRLEELSGRIPNDPSNVDARFEIATVLLGLGRDEQAAALVSDGHPSRSDTRPRREALADFYASRGMDELARTHRRIADEAKRNDLGKAGLRKDERDRK